MMPQEKQILRYAQDEGFFHGDEGSSHGDEGSSDGDEGSSHGSERDLNFERDLKFLREAIGLAREARALGRHPFGALIVDENGEVVAAAHNNAVRPEGEPTQHAETRVCSDAAKRLSEAELAKCTLYTSTEPCAMCAGAIYWIGVGRVVFGLSEKGLLAFTGNDEENPTLDLPCREVFARGQKKIEVVGPLLEEEAGVVHEGFWIPEGETKG